MDKPGKLLISGVLAGIVLFIAAAISYRFTGNITDPTIKYFWRASYSIAWLYKLIIVNVSAGLVIALFYSFIYSGLPGKGFFKGIFFGLMLWSIMVTPPAVTALLSGTFTNEMIISWLLQGLPSYCCAGGAIGAIYK